MIYLNVNQHKIKKKTPIVDNICSRRKSFEPPKSNASKNIQYFLQIHNHPISEIRSVDRWERSTFIYLFIFISGYTCTERLATAVSVNCTSGFCVTDSSHSSYLYFSDEEKPPSWRENWLSTADEPTLITRPMRKRLSTRWFFIYVFLNIAKKTSVLCEWIGIVFRINVGPFRRLRSFATFACFCSGFLKIPNPRVHFSVSIKI